MGWERVRVGKCGSDSSLRMLYVHSSPQCWSAYTWHTNSAERQPPITRDWSAFFHRPHPLATQLHHNCYILLPPNCTTTVTSSCHPTAPQLLHPLTPNTTIFFIEVRNRDKFPLLARPGNLTSADVQLSRLFSNPVSVQHLLETQHDLRMQFELQEANQRNAIYQSANIALNARRRGMGTKELRVCHIEGCPFPFDDDCPFHGV